ncbi:MAG: Rrf2 family transcriptional regulator [Bacteroidales bacterium]|nr:Rrf2 family transcriptional regulator [Bacteroidales bacterium]
MSNTRFATAIHILTLLTVSPGEYLSSEWIASSIGINPVIVRKELSMLHEAKLVFTRKGKDGGSTLNKPATEIFLADIYIAVKNSEVLGKKNQCPNPLCPIGKRINEKLENLFSETDRVVINFLKDKTLAEFASQFH